MQIQAEKRAWKKRARLKWIKGRGRGLGYLDD